MVDLLLRRQTFRLCSIARGHLAFTVHDRGVIEIVQDGDFRMFVADMQANVYMQAFTVRDRGFIEIMQDGDFRMFVADLQANVACTDVVLIQA